MEENRIVQPTDLTDRPLYREALEFTPESGRRLARILQAYRFPKQDYVPCGISSCRTPHGSGFLVEASDGLETNIGNRCGAKHLGADFRQERSRFKVWERRQHNRATITEFQDQAEEHRQRLDTAIDRAAAFWRFKKALPEREARALIDMGKTGHERVDTPDRLSRNDAKNLYDARGISQKFSQWYDDAQPCVADLQLHFQGTRAMVYPFHDTLVVKLQKPLQELMAMGKTDIDEQTDRQLDAWRQQIQAAPRLMREAESALDHADALMAFDSRLFRFLPGVYDPTEDD